MILGARDGGATIERATARLQSTELLRDRILNGEVVAGQRLNEVELAAEFGMSRGPIRESLQTLAAEGLVVIRSHKGTFVKDFSKKELESLYTVRVLLETYATEQAADQRTERDIERLGELLDLTNEHLSADGVFLYENDFHAQVLAMTQNSVLTNLAHQVLAQMALARVRSARSQARAQEALAEHLAIFHAIEAGDRNKAASLMKSHLSASYANVLRAFESKLSDAK